MEIRETPIHSQTGQLNLSRIPPPAWVKKLLDRVKAGIEGDDDVFLLQHFKGEVHLRRLTNDPDVLYSLIEMHKLLQRQNISNADERVTQFLFAAAKGYTLANSAFKLPPSLRCPDIVRLANSARQLAMTIKLEAKSFFPCTDRLSYLLERLKKPRLFSSAEVLVGLRADRFKISPLPELHQTLICFAEALEEQALLIKATPRGRQTPLSKYIDRLIRKSDELFPEINRALIAKVASVVSDKDVSPSTVEKRVNVLTEQGKR